MNIIKESFNNIFEMYENIDQDSDLYLPNNQEWDLNTICIISSHDINKKDYYNYNYIFGVYTLYDIIENAKDQKKYISKNDLLKSIIYYYNNDAFITF